jgi:FkbM family methyltransferase
LAVLRHNIAASGLANVVIEPVAAGRVAGMHDLFVRGERSAVNSLFPNSCYSQVTEILRVPVVPLDELVDEAADVVKIDVEGAELDVLEGMPRLLREPRTALIVEWHPLLQQMAGFAPDALPRWLIERGWRLRATSHLTSRALAADGVPALTARLLRKRGPVELVATRAW